jgi:hypothetical protein
MIEKAGHSTSLATITVQEKYLYTRFVTETHPIQVLQGVCLGNNMV